MGSRQQQYPGVSAASESSIEITFSFKGKRCRERVRLKPSPANLKRAANHRSAVLHAIEAGTFDYNKTFPRSKNVIKISASGAMSVAEYLTFWLEEKKAELAESTWDGYRKIVTGHLIPSFSNILLCEFRRTHARSFASKLNCKRKTINNILSPLRVALECAVDEYEIIDSNTLDGWSYKKKEEVVEDEEEHVDPFEPDEQVAILSVASEQIRNLFQFAFWSGLRTSELVALKWRDIDWIGERIFVKRAKANIAKRPGPTKTKAGNRTVKMLTLAKQALLAQKKHTFMRDEYIFHDPAYGEPFPGDQAIRKKYWTPALKKAGVRYRNPYQTRHTYASMLLSAGEHVMWVSAQMGHKDWMMVAKTYGKWMPSADLNAGQKAEKIFGENQSARLSL